MPTIDADAHVMEGPQTWTHCDPSERKYMPILLDPAEDVSRQFWLIDGRMRGHTRHRTSRQTLEAMAAASGRDMAVDPEARDMLDVQARIRHMDRTGVDIQILYPTFFIQQVTDKAEWEVPICKSYNRWMADIWRQGQGRLRWVCPLPLLSMPDALDMLPWCQENGAVAVLMRPIEGERLPQDPYFFPLYEKASRLNMPIGMHIGGANPYHLGILNTRIGFGGGFWSMCAQTAGACHALIANQIPELFPQLRFGFVEASASWIPWVVKDIRRRAEGRNLPENLFEAYRLYVSCYSSTDDIEYIAKYSGEDVLMTGTDFGHVDMSVELDALRSLSQNGSVRPELARKILRDNPTRFHGLEEESPPPTVAETAASVSR
jgi:predicted TIM-barrel fold metal-dependent hydrolase